jgi:hypothetical protein
MTGKVYKSAMGRPIDMGALFLQNEGVRAVGNMNINARGDVLDSANRVIDQKNRQVQRQYRKQTNVTASAEVHTSTSAVKRAKAQQESQYNALDSFSDIPVDDEIGTVAEENTSDTPQGGLAAAIARSRTVKQEKEKTLRELQQEKSGVKRI